MSDIVKPKYCDYCGADIAQCICGSAPVAGSADSRNIYDAIEQILTLAGIAWDTGWELSDWDIPRKLDMARRRFQELYNRPQNDPSSATPHTRAASGQDVLERAEDVKRGSSGARG